jgi:hypothetical protein
MRESGRAWLWLAASAGGFTLAMLGACSGAAHNSLLDAPADAPDATGSKPIDSGHDAASSGSSSGNGDDGSDEAGPVGNCSTDTCADGCCDSNGRCQSGDQNSQCGSNGASCQNCADVSGVCAAKTCLASASSGSGSGGMGSGSSSSSGGAMCNALVCTACAFGTPCCRIDNMCGCMTLFCN